jgi:hypothetical protein
VQNDSSAPVKVTATDITAMPQQRISVNDHGKTVSFEGVPLRQVLERVGVTLSDSLRGKWLSSFLLVEAADGYRVVFAFLRKDCRR